MSALSFSTPLQARAGQMADFRSYLEQSIRDPFSIDLKDLSLIEVILACVKAKIKLHPNYRKNLNCLFSTYAPLRSNTA